MTRQDFNQALLQTSFLYGANAPYIEELQARYEKDPASVEPDWRDFFAALGDYAASVEKTARGPEPQKDHEELHPSNYGFSEADYARKIFIDNVLGLESATIPEMLAIL